MSQWKLFDSIFDLTEVTFPTSCIVLPYELEKNSLGGLRTHMKNTDLANEIGLIIADITYYLHCVSDIRQSDIGESFSHKTREYMEKNRVSTSAPEDTLVRICKG